MDPFEALLDVRQGDAHPPEPVASVYGSLGWGGPTVYANFVQSLDGVVRLGGRATGGAVIADHSEADRFLIGLLRAHADAVLIGAGTLRGSPRHRWTAEAIQPRLAGAWAELRASSRQPSLPLTVVVTANGDIDPRHPALSERALVITNAREASRLAPRVPATCAVEALAERGPVDLGAALELIRQRAGGMILSEAGPRVMGQLVDDRLVDQVFVTISPLFAGRALGYEGLVAGRAFLPDRRRSASIVSVHRHGDHLFLRYRLDR